MTLEEIRKKISSMEPTCKATPYNMAKMRVDSYNKETGTLNLEDGYECPICKNKGTVARVEVVGGNVYTRYADCKCMPARRSIMRMKRSGLEKIIGGYTFERYSTEHPWQKTVKAAAMEYACKPDGWFFFGGQSGSGKTHICTAICRQILRDQEVRYMLWRDEIVKLKSCVNDFAEYKKQIKKYKDVPVLYIDDLFKTGRNDYGTPQKPTSADINIAFEILNFRYNENLPTIISSECTINELLDIDEAIAGRIMEKSKPLSIRQDRSRNYRLRNLTEL